MIVGSTFSRNVAEYGGSVNQGGNDGKIFDSVFEYNNAKNGGAVNWYWCHNNEVVNSTFIQNTADSGGAINLFDCDNLSISDSTFAKNVAKMNGGGINGGGNLGIFSNSKFEYNTAEVCG